MTENEVNPDDVLSELGLTTDEAAPGQGYQAPTTDPITGLPTEFTKPGEALPAGQRNGPLEQARILATLGGGTSPSTGKDRFAAGLGAKLGAAPQHPVAAALDGGFSGFAAAYGANKKKGDLSNIKERMGLLKTLFDMDRSLARDRTADSFRERALTATERRTDAYLQRQGRPNAGRPVDPLVRAKRIEDEVRKHPSFDILKADDELRQRRPNARRLLSPEARKAHEDNLAKERQKWESIGDGTPATPSPTVNAPSVDSAAPSVNPAPPAPVDPATPAPAQPAPARRAAPPAPRMTREQVIEQGRAANQNGAPLEAIIGRAKERGFDLTVDDFLSSPAPSAPAPQTDATGAVTGPQASNQNIMSVLASLFG